MTLEENKALLRRITDEIWNGRRLDLIDELVAEEFVDHVEMPVEGEGRDRYRATVEAVHRAFSDYHEEIELIVAEDDLVVSSVTLTGTHDGDYFGMPPTGRRVEYRAMGILRVSGGQAAERWGVGDSLALMRQLGL